MDKNNPIHAALPITAVLGELQQALGQNSGVVLQAPPGAGKSTYVPLELLNAPWLRDRKIVMLAPRRLAARAAAGRMADLLGQRVGQTVGYRVRMDSRIGKTTRIEVITEGVLTRMLQSDPSLEGVGVVIFDEFHERSLEADLGLALCLDMQGVLNVDLRLLVMSATIETAPVAALLGGAPIIHCEGRTHAIETRYLRRHTPQDSAQDVVRAVLSAANQKSGSILVFLPGAREIRRVQRLLTEAALGPEWMVAPLYGQLSRRDQDRAISPPPNDRRKIVLATAIAETSLTIEGIRVVVDGGLQRVSRFDVRSGMSRLVTLPVSRASADQRRGRAGRLGPGVCLRLWSQATHGTLAEAARPDILDADLSALALELARWGVRSPGDLKWLDPPPGGAYAGACELLVSLNAMDAHLNITDHGRKMAALPTHPRLAHMLIMAHSIGETRAACDLAALLGERDPLRFDTGRQDVDLQIRFDLLQAQRNGQTFTLPGARINDHACQRIIAAADQLHRLLGNGIKAKATHRHRLGRLLAWAYPDRIALRRPGTDGRYLLTGGQGVRLDPDQPMVVESLIVAAEVDGHRRDGRIYRAAVYGEDLLREQFAAQLQWKSDVQWDAKCRAVVARRNLRLGALMLHSEQMSRPDGTDILDALIQGIAHHGIDQLPWTKALRRWQARISFLRCLFADKQSWPDISDRHLTDTLDIWLAPFLPGMTNLRDLGKIDLQGALHNQLTYAQHRELDSLAPSHWTVPSGSRIPIDYAGKVPILAVRLQEMFGGQETPTIAGGRQPLLLHLLSPAQRPVQVTQDLAGFWKTGYLEVKKELKGRYPKHHWPENPLEAKATARAKPR